MKTWRIALILLVLALLVVVPAYAQEATETAVPTESSSLPESQPIAGAVNNTPSENQAPGLTAGVLLIGLGAAAAVGGLSLLRENNRAQQGK
jgi:hypothetical protein